MDGPRSGERGRQSGEHRGWREAGHAATVWVQALHELAPPRRYRAIVACGVFGLDSTRAQDKKTLHRFHESLEPGGTLLLGNEVTYACPRPHAAMGGTTLTTRSGRPC